MHVRTLRQVVATCAVLSLAGAVTSCGSGSASAEGDTDANESSGGGAPLTVITTAEHNTTMLGPDATNYLGSWDECAPDAEIETSVSDTAPEALASGAADIATTSPNSLIAAINQGLDAKIVGASMDAWVQFPVVPNDSSADSFADLKGGTFGVSRHGAAGHYATMAAAQSMGWGPGDYDIQPMGSFSSLQAALSNATIDAFLWSGTGAFTLEDNGDARVFEGVQDEVGPNAMTVWAVTDDVLEERPDDVRAVMQCMYDSVAEVKADEQLATEMFESWDYSSGATASIVDTELQFASVNGNLDEAMLEGLLESAHATIPETESVSIEDLREMIQPWDEL